MKSDTPLYLRSKGLHDSQHTTSSKALFTPAVLKTSVYIECTGYASQVYKFLKTIIYSLLYRPTSLRKSRSFFGSIQSNKCLTVLNLWYLCLTFVNSLQSSSTCRTVSLQLQLIHSGISSPARRKLWVSLVWPIFKRVKITQSFLGRRLCFLGCSFGFSS